MSHRNHREYIDTIKKSKIDTAEPLERTEQEKESGKVGGGLGTQVSAV
jgi:hypothetical protein